MLHISCLNRIIMNIVEIAVQYFLAIQFNGLIMLLPQLVDGIIRIFSRRFPEMLQHPFPPAFRSVIAYRFAQQFRCMPFMIA